MNQKAKEEAARMREMARIIRERAEYVDGRVYYEEIGRAQRMLICAWKLERGL